jgi:hypothetical protein
MAPHLRLGSVTLGLLLATVSLQAHHSVAGEFDGSQPITLRGTLTQVKWASPHIWLYVDVRDAAGNVVNWGIEGAPPSRANASGIKDALRIGDFVIVNAYRARDKSRNDVHAYDLLLADGHRFVIGLKLN